MRGIAPRKSLGQHFLRDAHIAQRIVEALHVREHDVVMEIGPGEGALTVFLVETAARLVLVDVDPRVVQVMRERFGARAEVIQADILTIHPADVARNNGVPALQVVGNIPYYISSPILFHFLDRRAAVGQMVLMMQREVGRRIAAGPGTKDYGIVSVIVQMFADTEVLFDVSPGSFFPPPSVTSSVVRIRMLPEPRYALDDEGFFRRIVRGTFAHRRKMLRNSLQMIPEVDTAILDPDMLTRRPEELSVGEFAALANTLWKNRTRADRGDGLQKR